MKKNEYQYQIKRIFSATSNALEKNSTNRADQFLKISFLVRSLLQNMHLNKDYVYDVVSKNEVPEDVKKDWEDITRLLDATIAWAPNKGE